MGVTSDNEYIIALSFPPTHRRMVVNLLTVVAMGMYKQQAGFSKPFLQVFYLVLVPKTRYLRGIRGGYRRYYYLGMVRLGFYISTSVFPLNSFQLH